MEKKKNTPEIRFPEFQGEWKQKKYGEIFSFRTTNSFSRENLNYENGFVKNIHYGDIHTKFSSLFDITQELVPFISPDIELNRNAKNSYCKEGDLIIADASEDYEDVGKCIEIVNLNNERVLAGLHTILARPDLHKMAIGFSGFLMKSENVRLQIKTIAQGSKVYSISSNRLAELNLIVPEILEQVKIASFLTAIDKKITQLKQKKILLEQYKKGVKQKLFSQELHFKDDNGKEFPKWGKKRLDQIIIKFIVPMRDKPKELTGAIPWCRIEDFDGKYLSSSKSGQGVTLKIVEEMNLKIYPINTLLVSCSANLGFCSIVKKELITNQTFIGLVPDENKIDIEFLYYAMTFSAKELNILSSGTTISYLSREQFEKFGINIPSIEEQTKIANFLSAIDEKIKHTQAQIEKTELYKKGLLQSMFC